MNGDDHATRKRRTLRPIPSASASNPASTTTPRAPTTAVKRDSLAAELERGKL
jgi:hypothetical protein